MKQLITFLSKLTAILLFVLVSTSLFSQKQLELISHLEYGSLANDVWGYTAPDGTEYALVGLRSGVSVVSLADPANPVEIQYIPGGQSTWRDLKTWGHFAYVTTDQPGTTEGLLVIDLSDVPNNVTWTNWKPVLPEQNDPLYTCHNLWIDEDGYCYLSGCDQNSGGVIILDVFSQPGQPQFVSYNDPIYAHDCFTQNNLLYTAEIYAGQFRVFDVADKLNPQLLATQQTPFEFCHNVWANADGSTLFTTDERANAPTAAYDLTDLGNIRLLDEFRPPATIGTGVIPHNAHVLGNYVVISNYTDGCVVVDATDPSNLIEVESYDTSPDFPNGFHGCWGAYPYFPSGLIAASDIENGLFIFKPTYPRAAYLEGNITDKVTGAPIANATIEILMSASSGFNTVANSGLTGEYKTGVPESGSYEVVFKAKGYYSLTANPGLLAGQTRVLDVELEPLPACNFGGRVVDDTDNEKPVSGASVILENGDFIHQATTNDDGIFVMEGVLYGDYTLYAGKWGFVDFAFPFAVEESEHFVDVHTSRGYEDSFTHDLGWQVESTADNGLWERGETLGIQAAGKQFTPNGDSPNDLGNRAYVTGNTGIAVHDDQVDNGKTRLTSPPMQLLSRYYRPLLSFDYWWYDAISNNPADDSLVVSINNGTETVVLATFATDADNVQAWTPADTFDLADYLVITNDMRISFTASDRSGTPNVVEAGLDNFRVWDALADELLTIKDDRVKMRIYPNPSADLVTLDYKIAEPFDQLTLMVVNVLGQIIQEIDLQEPLGSIQLDMFNEVAAPYFICFRVDGKISKAAKLLKVID